MVVTQPTGGQLSRWVNRRASVVGLAAAVAVGVGVGALTAYGQAWLNDSTTSLANSAGPWSVAAFLVARYTRRVPLAIVAAMLTLACCEFGYALATEFRGGTNASSSVVFWLTAALLAGPPLGVAGAWSAQTGLRRGVGFSVLGGVLLGEGLYGWSTIADTTDWRYWAIELVIGALVISFAAARSQWPRHVTLTLATGLFTAAVVFAFGRLA
jgi:Family of unknown function (DUF6518)